MDPQTSVPGLWQEAHNADGRAYYYNVQTKATQWTKPRELMTPVEVREKITVIIVSLTNFYLASTGKSTLEGVYHRCRAQILVQYRKQTEHMGDSGSLQRCACAGTCCDLTPSRVSGHPRRNVSRH